MGTPWGDGAYAYPTFLDRGGKSNYEIDANEFYILGKYANLGAGYDLNAMKLSLTIEGYSPPTVPTDEENLISQWYKELLGWTEPMTSAGFLWHVQNFNQNGCNADVKNFTESSVFINGLQKTTTNEQYVRVLYRAFLSREPDGLASGSLWWVNNLANGTYTRTTVIDALLASQEASNVCLTGRVLVTASVSPTPTLTQTPTPIPGDLTMDRHVNMQDLLIALAQSPLNIFTYNLVVANYGR